MTWTFGKACKLLRKKIEGKQVEADPDVKNSNSELKNNDLENERDTRKGIKKDTWMT